MDGQGEVRSRAHRARRTLKLTALLILLADRFTAALRRSPKAMRAVDYLFAGLMGAFAVRLLFARAD